MKAVPPDSIFQASSEHSLNVGQTIMRVLAWIAAWLLSVKLGDVQVVVGIIGGLLVAGYTALNTYVLWRDKVRKPSAPPGVAK